MSDKDKQSQAHTILEFIKSQPIGVVATVNGDGQPQAASMAISETDKLELIFQTPTTTNKYKNLQHNSRVAIVFGWDEKAPVTVQYEGEAREVTSADERDALVAIHVAKNPASKTYANLDENKFFIVTPTSVTYSNYPDHQYFKLTF